MTRKETSRQRPVLGKVVLIVVAFAVLALLPILGRHDALWLIGCRAATNGARQ